MASKKYFFQHLFLLGIFFSIVLFSCKKDTPASINFGYNYFPYKVNNYWIYDVDSLVFNSFTNKVDTFIFQEKEHIDSIIKDNTGRPTYVISRYKRVYNPSIPYNNETWIFKNVCVANITTTTAERVEDNQRFVKLIFPTQLNTTWNGNAQNTLGDWNYQYTAVDIPATYESKRFDSTATVTQINNTNLIQKQYYIEVYARNVGLVYKQIIDVQSDSITAMPLMNRINSGIEYTMTINSYGND
ncbi:MAG: hypothetical protein ABI199_09615 [Bacteroidia bacterium]